MQVTSGVAPDSIVTAALADVHICPRGTRCFICVSYCHSVGRTSPTLPLQLPARTLPLYLPLQLPVSSVLLLCQAEDIAEMQPLGDRVLVKVEEVADVTVGGVILPDAAKERPLSGTVVG